MDYRAIAELVMFAFIGLSTLAFAIGFSVRMFLVPTMRELRRIKGATADEGQAEVVARIDHIEDRLDSIESGINRLLATSEFDRQLEAPKGE